MSNFQIAVALTLQHEGGFVHNVNDSGGATNFGITQADLPGQDISKITPQQATAYYQEHYWKPLYSEIGSQAVCSKIFDMGVLAGVGTAVKCLQRALGLPQSEVDGVFGVNTLAAVNNAGEAVLEPYKQVLISHFQNVVAAHPEDAVFLRGWENRVNS